MTAEELCDAIRTAAERTRLQGHAGGGDVLELRFGKQLHTRVLRGADTRRVRNTSWSTTGQVDPG